MKETNASAWCFDSNVVNTVMYRTVLYCTSRPYDNFRRISTSTIKFSTRTLKMTPPFRNRTGKTLLHVRVYWIISYGRLKSRNPIICTVWFYHFSSNRTVALQYMQTVKNFTSVCCCRVLRHLFAAPRENIF